MEDVLEIEGHEKTDGRLGRGDEKQAQDRGGKKPVAKKGKTQDRGSGSQFNKNEKYKSHKKKRHQSQDRRIPPPDVWQLIHSIDEEAARDHQQNSSRKVNGYSFDVFFAFFQKLPGEVGAPNA